MASEILAKYPFIKDDVLWDYFRDEGIVYFPSDDSVLSLNESSVEILKKINGKKDLKTIISELNEKFSCADDTIKNDVVEFVEDCIKKQILGTSNVECKSRLPEEL